MIFQYSNDRARDLIIFIDSLEIAKKLKNKIIYYRILQKFQQNKNKIKQILVPQYEKKAINASQDYFKLINVYVAKKQNKKF